MVGDVNMFFLEEEGSVGGKGIKRVAEIDVMIAGNNIMAVS